jgi:hypothetical protein
MRGHDHVQEKFGAIDQLSGWDMEFDVGGWFLEVVEWVHLKAVPRMVFAKLKYLLTERSVASITNTTSSDVHYKLRSRS